MGLTLINEKSEVIRRGEKIPIEEVVTVVREATEKRRGRRQLWESVEGDTLVIGPIRGHGCDFANLLLTRVNEEKLEHIVLLGNYIDGGHQSVEVIYLIALLILESHLNIVPLIGRHEYLYPTAPETFGSLQNELILRSIHTRRALFEYETCFKEFFSVLSVGCVVDRRYLCVAGGPASTHRFLVDAQAEVSMAVLHEFILNEQMDEDEERIADKCAFIKSQNGPTFRFTFNAVCNFISRNHLACLIIGMEYHTSRPEYDSFAKPNHYKESIYFPGYTLTRMHPQTHMPAVTAIFTAPSFCGVNRNNGSCVRIANQVVKVHEFEVCRQRPLITPGRQDHAFSWSQPMMENAVTDIIRLMVFAHISEPKAQPDEVDAEYALKERVAVAKMYRMCQLLKQHQIPLPVVPPFPTDEPPAAAAAATGEAHS